MVKTEGLRDPIVAESDLPLINQAHADNESSRDAFLAVAHTALFAASIAFVADVAPVKTAVWKPALLLGWLVSVIGLFALTASYAIARRVNDRARKALYEKNAPSSRSLDVANAVALWSFPLALLCVFGFATSNVVVEMMVDEDKIPKREEKGIGAPQRAPERPAPESERPVDTTTTVEPK